LKNLKTDYVDLYLIHWPVSGKRKETWRALEKIYKDGRAKAIGVSNFMIRHLQEIIEDADINPAVNQVEFTPFLYRKKLMEFCHENGIQLEAYSPLARARRLDDPTLKEIAEKYSKTPAQVMLRWGLEHEVVVIPKSVNKKRIAENFDIFDFQLSEEDMSKLDNLDEGYRLSGWDPENDEMFK
ncbi:MAG: aldo/keto reductase, partial [Promethearchaeota archaeon]